jgi:serine/threonine protein kinase
MKINYNDDKEVQKIEDEVVILKKLKHQNIIKFVDFFKEKDMIIIVMELANHGSL